jgi:methylated-DNA-[protein]-cysteine S-methyltransferase
MPIEVAALESPVGMLSISIEDGVVRRVGFVEARGQGSEAKGQGSEGVSDVRTVGSDPWPPTAGLRPLSIVDRIRAYFDGDIQALDGIPVDPQGTPFQRDVWHMLLKIPAGRTWSYAELARAIGRPDAVRAVGAANGANPIPIVIPCHRVIGADGRLVGYGGGLDRKRWLLTHEGCRLL